MPRTPPPHLPDTHLGDFKQWRPEFQARALELLREHENTGWHPFYCRTPDCDGRPHDDWLWEHAREDQHPPKGLWLTWLLMGGRGSGKTRTGSESTHQASRHNPRISLVAATGPDLRETMVEGESGILATSPPGKRPLWEPSKKKLTWPNGCIGQGFSAEEPDRLRGPEFGFAWCDEPGHWDLAQACWDNMLFGLRAKTGLVRIVATSTPKPTKFFKTLVKEPTTVNTRVSTYANIHNLAPAFAQIILSRYEGTRLGKQELHGEILEDVEGALWTWDMFTWTEETQVPPMTRMVVGIDPAGSTNKNSDETGIVTVGLGEDKHLYVWADTTGKYSPGTWAAKANSEYDFYKADALVPEKNYGGDMVTHTLESSGYSGARIIPVDSRRGKQIRAEPIVALYERHRVHHVGRQGDLDDLETELTTWVPGEGDSPNRLDALVHACTELAKVAMPAQIADPNKLLQRTPTLRHLRAVQ